MVSYSKSQIKTLIPKLSKTILILMPFLICILLSSCKNNDQDVKKIKDLEYTIVEDADVPVELKTIIDGKKEKPFKLSFSNTEYLYIVVGYGAQNTGGYSITVDELYLTDNSIYIDTNLIGPSKEDIVTQAITYPYIVVKTEYLDKKIVFN